MAKRTTFLNVDLDITSAADLTPLASAVEAAGAIVLTCHRAPDGSFCMLVEVGEDTHSMADTIDRLIDLVDTLDTVPRRLFDEADSRTFNVGIEAGQQPEVHVEQLEPAQVAAIGRLHAGVAVTLYPPSDDELER